MNLLFTMKMLSDICFYFTFANFLSGLFGGENVLIATPIMAISAFLSFVFKDRGFIKYLPLALMVGCFFVYPMNLANVIVLLPPIFYIVYNVYKSNEFKSNFVYSDVFFLYLKIAGPFIALFLFYINKNTEQNSIPYAFIFLASSVILMRMLRQDESALNQTRFKLMAILPVIVALFAGLLVSSKYFFNIFKTIASILYFKIVVPIIMIFFTLASYAIAPLFDFFKLIFKNAPEVDTQNINGTHESIINSPTASSGGFEFLKIIITAIFIGLLIFFMFKLFKRLVNRQNGYAVNKGVVEERISIDENEKSHGKNKKKVNQVRLIFKKLMILCQKSGLPFKKSMTSLDYENFSIDEFKKDEIIKDIRSLYLDVRYGEKDISSEDFKRVKKSFGELKK